MKKLVDAAMELQAIAKKHFEADPLLEQVILKMEGLFQRIYDGEIPPKRLFEAITGAYEDTFEDHDDPEMYEAWDSFAEAYDRECLERLRGSVGSEFVDHVQARWSNRTCPACGGVEWLVPDCMYELREHHGGKLVLGGDARVMRVVPVVCQACGLTWMFSAPHAGLGETKYPWLRLPDSSN